MAADVWELIAAGLSVVRGQDSRSRHRDMVRQAKLILEDQTTDRLPVIEDLAVELGSTTSRRSSRRKTGFSPSQWRLAGGLGAHDSGAE
jgi:hypothetical protein